MIFYFTATGNSLYVARELARVLEDGRAPVSIPGEGDGARRYADGAIGFVFPVFAHMAPPLVREFLERNEFEAEYAYVVSTHGSTPSGAPQRIAGYCRTCGIELDYAESILMVDNYLPGYDVEQELQLDKRVPEQLERVCAELSARKRRIPEATEEDRLHHEKVLERGAAVLAMTHGELFRVDASTCTGCAVCSAVCPRGCYDLVDDVAVHTGTFCEQCLACVHACPNRALGLTLPEKNPAARYRNPNVTLGDIIKSNS